MDERALALDEEQLSAPLDAFDDELLRRAGEEVRRRPRRRRSPSRRSRSRLSGRDELRREARAPRRAVELERDGHLPDRAVGADRQHDRRAELQVRAGRDVQVGGRLAQVAQPDAVPRRELAQLGIVGEELVQAVLDVEAFAIALFEQLAPGRREAAALRRDADERGRRLEAERLVDRADDRDPVLRLARLRRVEDRDDAVARRTRGPRARSCRSGGRPRSPRRGSGTASRTPSPGSSGG